MAGRVLSVILTIVLIERCFLCVQASIATYSGCSPGRQRVISYNTSLVPPSGVSAFRQETTFNPDDYLFHRNNLPLRLWCTDDIHTGTGGLAEGMQLSEWLQSGGPIYDINVTFSEPLLLTHLLSSGFSNSYVNNFTIAWSLEEGGPLLPYVNSDESKEFVVAKVDTVFEFSPPLAARRIRFDILDGLVASGGKLCWHLTLLGCTLPEAVPSLIMDPLNLNDNISENTIVPLPTPECNTADFTASPTSSILSSSTSSNSSSLPSSFPSATPSASSSFSSPSTSVPATQTEVITNSSPSDNTESAKESCNRRIILIVVPMAIAGLLMLACLFLMCVCFCLGRKYTRDEAREFPEGQTDALGMVDNELYKSRSSVYPVPIAQVKHMPTHDNKNGNSTCSNRGGNALANMSREAMYENCDSVISAFRGSRFGDSMNPRSTCTTEFEQSVDSMVDNPTYSVPFPVDYHSVKPFTKRNAFSPILALSSRAIGASSIDMVDNECYSVPSLSKRDDMEQSLVAVVQEPPLDYETPK